MVNSLSNTGKACLSVILHLQIWLNPVSQIPIPPPTHTHMLSQTRSTWTLKLTGHTWKAFRSPKRSCTSAHGLFGLQNGLYSWRKCNFWFFKGNLKDFPGPQNSLKGIKMSLWVSRKKPEITFFGAVGHSETHIGLIWTHVASASFRKPSLFAWYGRP